MRLTIAALAIALAGCPGPATSAPPKEREPMAVNVKNAQDVQTNDGKPVTAIGTYEIEDMGRYRYVSELPDGTKLQSNKLVYLKLDDGTDVRLGARPDPERAKFENKRVIVRGKMIANPPRQPEHVAQMDPAPTIVMIEDVSSAP